MDLVGFLALKEYKALNKDDMQHFFQRCQHFYVELCCQRKKQLPLDNEVLKQLKFPHLQMVVN